MARKRKKWRPCAQCGGKGKIQIEDSQKEIRLQDPAQQARENQILTDLVKKFSAFTGKREYGLLGTLYKKYDQEMIEQAMSNLTSQSLKKPLVDPKACLVRELQRLNKEIA